VLVNILIHVHMLQIFSIHIFVEFNLETLLV